MTLCKKFSLFFSTILTNRTPGINCNETISQKEIRLVTGGNRTIKPFGPLLIYSPSSYLIEYVFSDDEKSFVSRQCCFKGDFGGTDRCLLVGGSLLSFGRLSTLSTRKQERGIGPFLQVACRHSSTTNITTKETAYIVPSPIKKALPTSTSKKTENGMQEVDITHMTTENDDNVTS